MLVITISSGLSGTHNMLRLMSEEYEGLRFPLWTPRTSALAPAFRPCWRRNWWPRGGRAEHPEQAEFSIKNSRTYFCLDTLEYLIKGGRIGKVMAVVGSLLRIRPVISCNEEGCM